MRWTVEQWKKKEERGTVFAQEYPGDRQEYLPKPGCSWNLRFGHSVSSLPSATLLPVIWCSNRKKIISPSQCIAEHHDASLLVFALLFCTSSANAESGGWALAAGALASSPPRLLSAAYWACCARGCLSHHCVRFPPCRQGKVGRGLETFKISFSWLLSSVNLAHSVISMSFMLKIACISCLITFCFTHNIF